MPDPTTHIDIPIPETGWERVHLDPDTQDPWMLDALSGPAPAWLYAAVRTADEHRSGLHVHPADLARLHRADWSRYLPIGSPVLGCPVIADPTVPEGSVRIRMVGVRPGVGAPAHRSVPGGRRRT